MILINLPGHAQIKFATPAAPNMVCEGPGGRHTLSTHDTDKICLRLQSGTLQAALRAACSSARMRGGVLLLAARLLWQQQQQHQHQQQRTSSSAPKRSKVRNDYITCCVAAFDGRAARGSRTLSRLAMRQARLATQQRSTRSRAQPAQRLHHQRHHQPNKKQGRSCREQRRRRQHRL